MEEFLWLFSLRAVCLVKRGTNVKRSANTAGRAVFIIIALAVTGCATVERDLVRDKIVRVQEVASAHAIFTSVSVIQQGSKILITGFLRSRLMERGPIPGRVKVEIVNPDGKIMERYIVSYGEVTILSEYAMFNLAINTAPPKGSTIRVIHDDGSYQDNGHG